MLLRIGASAMIGSALATAANGIDTSLSGRQRDAASAARIATTEPPTSPISAFAPLASAACQMLARCATNSVQISEGAGRM